MNSNTFSSLKGRLICYMLYGLPGYEWWWDQSWCQISYSYPGITFLFCIVMPTQFARLEETSAEIQPLSRPEIWDRSEGLNWAKISFSFYFTLSCEHSKGSGHKPKWVLCLAEWGGSIYLLALAKLTTLVEIP